MQRLLVCHMNFHMGSAGYTNMSALLYLSTNQSNPFEAGSMFRRTGLEGAKTSYTDEGASYTNPYTCVVSDLSFLPANSSPGVQLSTCETQSLRR